MEPTVDKSEMLPQVQLILLTLGSHFYSRMSVWIKERRAAALQLSSTTCSFDAVCKVYKLPLLFTP